MSGINETSTPAQRYNPLDSDQRRQLRELDQSLGLTNTQTTLVRRIDPKTNQVLSVERVEVNYDDEPDFEAGISLLMMGRELAGDCDRNDIGRLNPQKINEHLLEQERRKQIDIQRLRHNQNNPPPKPVEQPHRENKQDVHRQEPKRKAIKKIEEDNQLELFNKESPKVDNNLQIELPYSNNLNNDIVINRIISIEDEMVKIKISQKSIEKSINELCDKHGKVLEILSKMFSLISKKP